MRSPGKPFISKFFDLLGFVLVMVLICGCQSLSFDPRGHTVPESRWIKPPADGEESGSWTNEDLKFGYHFVRNRNQLRISGSIQFADRITKAYPVIQYFHMDVISVDADGKILDMVGLTSTASLNTIFDRSVEFNRIVTLPSNTQAIALSYRGKAYGNKDAGTMDFWEYPVY